MKIYFIIPVYKTERFLRRCIESVLSQTFENTVAVLVDDGSPDGCPKICEEYAAKFDNVTVLHKENGGLSDARNFGLDYVKNLAEKDDFIALLDSDDFVHPKFAEKMAELCEKYDCDLAQCEHEKGSKDEFESENTNPTEFCENSENALLGYKLKSQSTMKLYRARLFEQIRFPIGFLNEDEFTTYRLVYLSKKIAFTNEKLYYYFRHGSSIMDDFAKNLKDNPHKYDFLKAYAERAEFFENEKKPVQVLKTYEKICTDIILRYCEQMYLPLSQRDTDCTNGAYLELYRKYYKKMIKRDGIPKKRELMYHCFRICPYSAVVMGRIFTLRK